ncbi:hypothetical protein M4D79_22885 [Mycolicibacterium novocastrense]|nr:hypothetical protein M4D79_22885 [Mycolicibacterium novocastrense]
MTRVSVSAECDDCDIAFKSDDGSFQLRQVGQWWTVDEVDDRGKRYDSTVRLSTFELAEMYLIWQWAALTGNAVSRLGRRFHAQGLAPGIEVLETERDYFVELRAPGGSAILPLSSATVFSHLMSMSVDDLEQMVKDGAT